MPRQLSSIRELVAAPLHDLDWLQNALQVAIQLELATLPPYLTAWWTIKDGTFSDPVFASINIIVREEMLHFGLACNLLSAVDGFPLLADETVVPHYPGELPGGVHAGLKVALKKLSRKQVKVFMDIEYPQGGPVARARVATVTIGEFYEAILDAFKKLNPVIIHVDRQLENESVGLFKVESLAMVKEAIQLIKLQGEGSSTSPEENKGDLAHYYRFGEIYNGKRFMRNANGEWGYDPGHVVPMPAVHNMADVPEHGYQKGDVSDAVWEKIETFDRDYSEMLRLLQKAWADGASTILDRAVGKMYRMSTTAGTLVTMTRPDGQGNYGPCFRYIPE